MNTYIDKIKYSNFVDFSLIIYEIWKIFKEINIIITIIIGTYYILLLNKNNK